MFINSHMYLFIYLLNALINLFNNEFSVLKILICNNYTKCIGSANSAKKFRLLFVLIKIHL